jgi:hypothetical protein
LSYDYILSKGDPSMGLEELMESAMNGVIAHTENLKTSITNLFPSTRWTQSVTPAPGGTRVSWFGELQGGPEFHFMPEPDGEVRLLTMSHCERSEVELLARTLALVVLDQQTMEVFGG